MTPEELIAAFDAVAEAPDGVARLRELVLELAVRGRLVPQEPADEPASVLLERIAAEKTRLVRAGDIAHAKPLPPVSADEVPFDMPAGWSLVRFGDVFLTLFTGPFGTSLKKSDYRAGGTPVINPQNLRSGVIAPTEATCVGDDTLRRLASFRVKERDVVVARRGEMGRCAVVGRSEGGWLCGTGSLVLRPPLGLDARYVTLFLGSPWTVGRLSDDSVGSTMENLNQRIMVNLPFGLPPTAEQRRIVARVDELMGLLDRMDAARTTRDATRAAVRDSVLDALREADTPDEVEVAWTRFAERMDDLVCEPADVGPLRQAVLQLAVRGRLVPQDPSEKLAGDGIRSARQEAGLRPIEVSTAHEDEGAFSTPAGWTWAHVGDVADLRLGKMLDKAKNTGRPQPYLRNTNVHWFRFELESVKEMRVEDSELAELLLRPGDLLICEGGHGIARSAVWRGELDNVVFQKALHRVRPLSCLDSDFLSYCLRVQEANGDLQRHYTGAGIPHFTGRALARVLIPVPPMAEQGRIVARVDELMSLLDRLEARLTAARTAHAAFAAAAVHRLDG